MAVARYSWTRTSPTFFSPWLQTVWNAPGGLGVGAPVLVHSGGWTLRRTLWQTQLRVQVKGASGLPSQWWTSAQVRVGLKFAPDGSHPGMATNDESPEVVAIQQLFPSVAGDLTGVGPHSVVFNQRETLDVQTARKDNGTGAGVLWGYIWATDSAGVLATPDPPVSIGWDMQLSALWSQ